MQRHMGMDLASNSGQWIVVVMHMHHPVYGCDDFNES